ncbi:hypothetical protein KCP69_11550 [Salmonella enterica subsp. enterica]|nr:hypothetical protein KCP69_11550 [Salmonella enterica subsp. enterica]
MRGPVSTVAALHMKQQFPTLLFMSIIPREKVSIRELCTHDYQPENGYYVAPEQPGLGQELKR